MYRRPLSIVIPAAGVGSRMRMTLPKALIRLGPSRTLIAWQQAALRRHFPRADIVAVLGHGMDAVIPEIAPGTVVVENENYASTGVLRSIGMGMRATARDGLLVVYGDLVFNPLALGIVASYSTVLVDRLGMLGQDEVGLTVADGRVTQFGYDLPAKWGQVAYLTGRELAIFREVAWDRGHSRWFGYEGLNAVLSGGGCLRAVSPKGMRVVEIDSSRDVIRARALATGEGSR